MEPQKEPEKNIKSKVVETYAADMTKAIDGSEGIYIKKIIEEQEKREKENINLSPESKKNKTFMLVGLVLIVFGIISLLSFFIFKKEVLTVDVTPSFSPLVYLDGIQFLGIDGFSRDQIAQSIFNESILTKVKLGGVEGMYLTVNKQVIGLKDFMILLAPEVDLTKMVFVSNNFLLGVHNADTKNVFVLIKMRSFSDIFEVMRSWEDNMFNDLHTLFGTDLNMNTKYLLTKDFEDGIIQNHNARILRDANGNIVMMYAYLDDTSMLLTNSESTAREIMLRLSAGTIRK